MVSINEDVVLISSTDDPLGKLHSGWIVEKKKIEGITDVSFITVDPLDYRVKKFLKGKTGMLDKLINIRNMKSTNLMTKSVADPNSDVPDELQGGSGYHRRREMADNITKVIPITVELADETNVTVRVTSEWHRRSHLTIELTAASIELLLKEPKDDGVQVSQPENHFSHVEWLSKAELIQTSYYDAAQTKWRVKRMKLDTQDPSLKQSDFEKKASVLEAFYEAHHSEPPADSDADL